MIRLATYRAAGKTGITVWAAKWGPADAALTQFRTNAQQILDRVFASA